MKKTKNVTNEWDKKIGFGWKFCQRTTDFSIREEKLWKIAQKSSQEGFEHLSVRQRTDRKPSSSIDQRHSRRNCHALSTCIADWSSIDYERFCYVTPNRTTPTGRKWRELTKRQSEGEKKQSTENSQGISMNRRRHEKHKDKRSQRICDTRGKDDEEDSIEAKTRQNEERKKQTSVRQGPV